MWRVYITRMRDFDRMDHRLRMEIARPVRESSSSSDESSESAVDVDTNVFLMQRQWPAASGYNDAVVGVCSVADLNNYPVGSPDTDNVFFRTSVIDMVFRSSDVMDETEETILEDLAELRDNIADVNQLIREGAVFAGQYESSSSLSSSSESSSSESSSFSSSKSSSTESSSST